MNASESGSSATAASSSSGSKGEQSAAGGGASSAGASSRPSSGQVSALAARLEVSRVLTAGLVGWVAMHYPCL
jgi:hypothetical protein